MSTLRLSCHQFPGGILELHPNQLPLVIGRSNTADIKISDELLSRKHTEVRFANGDFELRDLDSTNLTIVNEKDIATHQLKTGDLILLGDTEIRVEVLKPEEDPSESTTRDLPVVPESPALDESS